MNLDFMTTLWPGARRPPPAIVSPLVPATPADFPAHLPTTDTDYFRQVASKRPETISSRQNPLLHALLAADRPLSITELAAVMGCSVGESSKRVKAAGRLVKIKRQGRCKLVSRRNLTWAEWQKFSSLTP